MKKFLMVATILCVGIAAKAQDNAVKVNVFSLVVSTFNVSYERVLNEGNSFQLGVFYTGAKIGDTKFSGFGITPEYRFYFNDNAPDGFYAAPFVRYQSFSLTADLDGDENKATYSTIGGGVIAGRHWILGESFSLDLFAGPSYNAGSLKVESGSSEDSFDIGKLDGFGFRFGLAFGLAF